MKTEVLNDIKKTETEYQSVISTAQEEKKKRRAQAELEADTLVTKAQSNAEQYKKLKLEEARHQAALKHADIIKEGNQRSAALSEKGKRNLSKAVQLLVSRFKEQLHVGA
ncbi:V-type H+-transporting ATPase subunit E [Methanoregula boonei 6A8]|jgi:V/A-type H+-transporting ATPase subunit G/H|uniref:V-type H+-transporting ATPase subunit E n=1 Tax=Methanoregula boonei (strain DSM 21154 / JCM 14090 / 6A8) TaxID=456442 RepID=A7IAV4_METB6|nr:ATPase [Methanoregula boonei]ABS56865.1 V-type H+-transporting ATPase subunit E [Methanoregula boonei 6A8]